MATLKLIAIGLLIYAVVSGDWLFVLWAVIVWEIGGGFHGSTILWISNFKDDHKP